MKIICLHGVLKTNGTDNGARAGFSSYLSVPRWNGEFHVVRIDEFLREIDQIKFHHCCTHCRMTPENFIRLSLLVLRCPTYPSYPIRASTLNSTVFSLCARRTHIRSIEISQYSMKYLWNVCDLIFSIPAEEFVLEMNVNLRSFGSLWNRPNTTLKRHGNPTYRRLRVHLELVDR